MKIKDIIEQLKENYGLDGDLEIKEVFCFQNNNVAVIDHKGKQIPFLQGLLKTDKIRK